MIDSSIAASWGLPDEDSFVARRALTIARGENVIVPSVFWHEVRNVFLVNERRDRLTSQDTEKGLALIMAVAPADGGEAAHSAILALARNHRLTAYDAAYVELAIRTNSKFATLDNRLASAARTEGVDVVA